jgi:hypothetical protein
MKNFCFTLLLCTCVLASCTDGFETINTNDNQPETVTPALLLPTVLFDLANLGVTENYNFGNTVGQYTANYEANDLDIYDWISDDRYWGIYGTLQDVEDIRRFGVDRQDANYEAVAIIIRSYGISLLTDVYGNVPFSEALRAEEGVFNPVYDAQEDIYEQLLADLKTANDLIDTEASISGDLLYGGDMMNWRRFANSLRLRLLLRSSDVREAAAEIAEIVNTPTRFPIFETNGQHAVYRYTGTLPNLSPLSVGRGRAYDYYLGIPTDHLIGLLRTNDDPRLAAWFDPKAGTDDYIGIAPGQSLGDIGRPASFASKDAAFFGVADKITSPWLTAAEVRFLLAEAAAAGLIDGSARDYYDQGVTLSFGQWGLDVPADFLTVTAPYDANTEVLAEQKWLAQYHNSVQGWLDWKRTGLPSFITAGPGTINNGEVPVRLMYPALEQSINAGNYQAAAVAIGGDNINSRVWWDGE